MKKIFTLAALVLFTLTSCSGDDNQNTVNTDPGTTPVTGDNDESAFLLKKMIETDQAGDTITSTFNYDGNKLLSIIGSDDSKEMYYYTNDKITKLELFENGSLAERQIFEYNDSGRLSYRKYYIYTNDWEQTYNYTYNNPGIINVQHYFNHIGDGQPVFEYNSVLTYESGNVTSYTDDNGVSSIHTYDSKNSPFKNIAGIDAMFTTYEEGGVNNILTYAFSGNNDSQTSTTTYTYNTNNFPVESVETDNLGTTYTTQYFYE